MWGATITGGPTFTLNEVAEITCVVPQLLRNWVARGVVAPVVWGSEGRGHTHRFSVQQLVGLAIGTAWWKSPRGCVLEMLGDTVRKYEAWTLSAIEGLLQVLPDEFTEEAFRKEMPKAKSPVGKVFGCVPASFEDVLAIFKVLTALKVVVLDKLSAGGRISGRTTRTKK